MDNMFTKQFYMGLLFGVIVICMICKIFNCKCRGRELNDVVVVQRGGGNIMRSNRRKLRNVLIISEHQ